MENKYSLREFEEIIKRYYELRKENQELYDHTLDLQNRIKELEAINEEHRKINGELRNRIDKAIEIIELWDMCGSELITTFQEKAINILQGSEDK